MPAQPPLRQPPAAAFGDGEIDPNQDGDKRHNLVAALVVGLVLLVLAGSGVGAWFWLANDSGTPVAGAEPSASDGPTAADPTTPAASPRPSTPDESPAPTPTTATPTPTRTATPPKGARLAFRSLSGKWERAKDVGSLLQRGRAQTRITESNYQGKRDWMAVLMSGEAPSTAQKGGLKRRAGAVSSWFVVRGFDPLRITPQTVESRPITVDGMNAYLLRQRFPYRDPDLRSRADLVTIIVVDMGPKNPTGVFIASLPQTHTDLAGDIHQARRSLRITPP